MHYKRTLVRPFASSFLQRGHCGFALCCRGLREQRHDPKEALGAVMGGGTEQHARLAKVCEPVLKD